MSEPIEALVERAKLGDRAGVEALVLAIQDDVYRLALRMLGHRAEAEDATQEIVLQALTHLSEFRGESAFRTWVWRIATRHVLRAKRGRREEIASFETLETLLAQGEANPPLPAASDAELVLLEEEVRLACTQGVVLSLARDLRISWILGDVFELSSEEAAAVLEVEPAAHRKRLSRAREKLGAWLGKHCGLADEGNACRCRRQIPVAQGFGVADTKDLQFAGHPARSGGRRALPMAAAEADEIEATVHALKRHPDYAAPEKIIAGIRAIIDSGRYRVFDA
jgi:RNA polymerase sigma factor (sigma-70 family)